MNKVVEYLDTIKQPYLTEKIIAMHIMFSVGEIHYHYSFTPHSHVLTIDHYDTGKMTFLYEGLNEDEVLEKVKDIFRRN